MENRRIRKRFLAGLFLLLLIGLLGIATWSSGSGSTLLCQKCHVMKPQVMTWAESSHRDIPCATCHINPKFRYRLSFSLGFIPKTYQTLTQSYILPIHVENVVSNEACLQCHTSNRMVTPRNDLIVPHASHYLNGVFCIDCHQGVTHGRIVERFQTIDGDFKKWTSEFAKQEMSLENLQIGMKECIKCHKDIGRGPRQCVGCHEEIITPDSHKNAMWRLRHGQEAILSVEACEECHNYTNVEGKPLEAEDRDVVVYARKNRFCADCHLNVASPHELGWAFLHTSNINREEADSCKICHELNQPTEGGTSTRLYCSKCHEENLGSAFFR